MREVCLDGGNDLWLRDTVSSRQPCREAAMESNLLTSLLLISRVSPWLNPSRNRQAWRFDGVSHTSQPPRSEGGRGRDLAGEEKVYGTVSTWYRDPNPHS